MRAKINHSVVRLAHARTGGFPGQGPRGLHRLQKRDGAWSSTVETR